jgi:hypothetical protein
MHFWVNPFSARAGLRALNGSPEGRIHYLINNKRPRLDCICVRSR